MIQAIRRQVSLLSPEHVEQYLRARGWVELSRSPGRAIRFEKGHHEVLVPLTRDVGDYALRLRDVVAMLERTEDRTATELIAEITQPEADVLDFRISAPEVGPGTIALPAGLTALEASAEALAAAVASTLAPRSTHQWSRVRQLDAFLETVVLAPAEPSSYATRFLVPTAHAGPVAERNLGRRVTQTLARALSELARASTAAALRRREALVAAGISAELCFAVADLVPPDSQQVLEVAFEWSRTRPIDASLPTRVSFAPSAAGDVLRLGEWLGGTRRFRLLRPSVGDEEELESVAAGTEPEELSPPRRGVTISGLVTYLADGNYVRIRGDVDDRERSVRVELDARRYLIAVRAHEEGKPVEVTGDLTDRARVPILSTVTSFRIAG